LATKTIKEAKEKVNGYIKLVFVEVEEDKERVPSIAFMSSVK